MIAGVLSRLDEGALNLSSEVKFWTRASSEMAGHLQGMSQRPQREERVGRNQITDILS